MWRQIDLKCYFDGLSVALPQFRSRFSGAQTRVEGQNVESKKIAPQGSSRHRWKNQTNNQVWKANLNRLPRSVVTARFSLSDIVRQHFPITSNFGSRFSSA